MLDVNAFAIIGGDKRQLATAESILDDGYKVYVAGFEKLELKKEIVKTTITDAIKKSNYIILPLPTVLKNNYLNAPYSNLQINLDDNFARNMFDKKVFCGNTEKLIPTSKIWNKIKLYDYSKKEEFAINNAVPTAEGAIEIAMRECEFTINNSQCLVTGFGRIGKILSKMLYGIGAKVTVSARNINDLSWINLLGYNAISIKELPFIKKKFDIIFNTIPALIFDEHILSKIGQKSIIIDLASMPGGVDFESAALLNIKTIRALALPGKVAPKTAGEIIKKIIYRLIKEG